MAPIRLCRSNIGNLPQGVAVPPEECYGLGVGIVHFGVGGFHRRHQALYTQRAIGLRNSGDWGIVGVGLLPTDVDLRDRLREQDFLYSVIERAGTKRSEIDITVVGTLQDFILPFESAEAALSVQKYLTAASTKVVTLTITEKGYFMDSSTGDLIWNHPMIQGDLKAIQDPSRSTPCSAIGYLTVALEQRRVDATEPFTVLSCDNVPENGRIIKKAIHTLAHRAMDQATFSKFVEYIDGQCRFPSTMVDGVTPVTYDRDIAWIRDQVGIDDRAPVVCEKFMDWIIEDNFVNDCRPPWDAVGARMVPDPIPYEQAKIRLLNVPHSSLTYPAYLLGLTFIHEALKDELIYDYASTLMAVEIAPTVQAPPGMDLKDYQRVLLERFANPAVMDTLERVAQDGSTKYANQLVPIACENLREDRSVKLLSLAVASWAKHLGGKDENGVDILVTDGRKEELLALMAEPDGIRKLVADKEIFGELKGESGDLFRQDIIDAYESLVREGVRKVYMDILNKVIIAYDDTRNK